MNYISFNVAQHGCHFFRTEEYFDSPNIAEVERVLASKFPAADGWQITRHERVNGGSMRAVQN